MAARLGTKIVPFGSVGKEDSSEVSFGLFCTKSFPLQIYYGLKMLVSGKEWPIVFMKSTIQVNYPYLKTFLYELWDLILLHCE